MADIVDVVDSFITAEDRRRWAKMSSTMNSRALEILLLREILVELRKLNAAQSDAANRNNG